MDLTAKTQRKISRSYSSPWSTKNLEYKTNYHCRRVWSRTPLSSSGLTLASTYPQQKPAFWNFIIIIIFIILQYLSVMIILQSLALTAIFWRTKNQAWNSPSYLKLHEPDFNGEKV